MSGIFGRRDCDTIRAIPARALQEGLVLLDRLDVRAELPRLRVPSLWISGRRDRLVPPAAMAWSAAQCGGRFVEIAHAGHAPFIGHAHAVADALQPLFADVPA